MKIFKEILACVGLDDFVLFVVLAAFCVTCGVWAVVIRDYFLPMCR